GVPYRRLRGQWADHVGEYVAELPWRQPTVRHRRPAALHQLRRRVLSAQHRRILLQAAYAIGSGRLGRAPPHGRARRLTVGGRAPWPPEQDRRRSLDDSERIAIFCQRQSVVARELAIVLAAEVLQQPRRLRR